MKALCRTFVLEDDMGYLIKVGLPVAHNVLKILLCLNEVTEL